MGKVANIVSSLWLLIIFGCIFYFNFIVDTTKVNDLKKVELKDYKIECEKRTSRTRKYFEIYLSGSKYKYELPLSFDELDECLKYGNTLEINPTLVLQYKFEQTVWDILENREDSTMSSLKVFSLHNSEHTFIELEKSLQGELENRGTAQKFFIIVPMFCGIIYLIGRFKRRKSINKYENLN
jgi:hypothetical protein